MFFSVVNVSAASVSKTKTGTVTCGNYGSLSVYDTATRNTTTGEWTTLHVIKTASLSSGYRTSASNGGSKTLSNNGLTLKHNAAFSVYYNSNSSLVGVYFKLFTFNYDINTNKIS